MFARLPPAIVLTLAIIAGACMDATIKHLLQSNHVLLVAFGRYLFGGIFSALIHLPIREVPVARLAGTPAR